MKITIFVPTYNRGGYLPRIYDSLKKQNFSDFELLIIDDGSVDNTKTLVDSWIIEQQFSIKYFFQQNSGKHMAYNFAIKEAHGELFLELDSDDYLVPDALNKIIYHWSQIENKDNFAGMQCLCMDENGTIIGSPFKRTITNNYELRFIDKVKGDKGMIYQTSKLKNYSLPNIKNEIVKESILHNRISQKLNTKCIHEPLIIKQYLSDGLSKTSKTIFSSINSSIIYYNELNYFKLSFSKYVFINSRFVKFSLFNGDKFNVINKNAINKRFYFLYAYLLGLISYMKQKKLNNIKQ